MTHPNPDRFDDELCGLPNPDGSLTCTRAPHVETGDLGCSATGRRTSDGKEVLIVWASHHDQGGGERKRPNVRVPGFLPPAQPVPRTEPDPTLTDSGIPSPAVGSAPVAYPYGAGMAPAPYPRAATGITTLTQLAVELGADVHDFGYNLLALIDSAPDVEVERLKAVYPMTVAVWRYWAQGGRHAEHTDIRMLIESLRHLER